MFACHSFINSENVSTDAETAVTVHTIRMWCKEGKIKCLTAGNKVLVDIDSLMNYIAIKE